MKKIIYIFLILLTSSTGFAEIQYLGNYDGDTLRVNIPEWPDIIGKNISIRVNGIDTPDIRDKRPEVKTLALHAKNRLKELLSKAKKIELLNIKRGKYFRIIADVYVDGVNVSKILLQEGLAKPYDGKTKPKW